MANTSAVSAAALARWRWMDGPGRVAAICFAIGLLILVSPVEAIDARDKRGTYDDTLEPCGMAIASAWVIPSGVDDEKAEWKVACAASARGRIGYGVLLILLSVPAAFVSLRRTLRGQEEAPGAPGMARKAYRRP